MGDGASPYGKSNPVDQLAAGIDKREHVRTGTLQDLLPGIGDKAFRRFGFVQSSVLLRWTEIAGDRLAARTKPLSLRFPRGKQQDGTLHIAVEGAHGPIIQLAIPEIIERVNGFFGYRAVSQIKLQQGRAPRAPHTTTSPPTARSRGWCPTAAPRTIAVARAGASACAASTRSAPA